MSTTTDYKRLEDEVRVIVDKIAQEQGQRLGRTMGPAFVNSLSDIVYKQMETFAIDTQAFASHARRAVINADDVMLCARRNDDLYKLLDKERNELQNTRTRHH